MKIYFKKAVGQKSNKKYNALVLDLGYRQETLTFNASLIAEILNVTVRDLDGVNVGDYEVGEIKDNINLTAKTEKGGK